MARLLSVKKVMERYQCSRQTAVRYMRRLEHMEKPLTIKESVLDQWDLDRTVKPPEVVRHEMAMKIYKRRRA